MLDLLSLDTSLNLERLRGQNNYLSQVCNFKFLIELKGVQDFYTREELILQKLLRETYNIKPYKIIELDIKTREEIIDTPNTNTTLYITQYKLELEEYKYNQKKLYIVKALLSYQVDLSIRGYVQSK